MVSGLGEAVNLPPLSHLLLWRDPVARGGLESMAVDEVLLSCGASSVMRAYAWGRPTVTYGYFDSEDSARQIFPDGGIEFVRRWTGGGIVDHRHDIPFSLALRWEDRPGRPVAPSLYRWIHGGLARVLKDCGVACEMLTGDAPDGGRACFSSPVTSDLILPGGDKLARGGQRRSQQGVLHQGSIQNCLLLEGWDLILAKRLCDEVQVCDALEPFEGFSEAVSRLLEEKYGRKDWNNGGRRRSLGGTERK